MVNQFIHVNDNARGIEPSQKYVFRFVIYRLLEFSNHEIAM